MSDENPELNELIENYRIALFYLIKCNEVESALAGKCDDLIDSVSYRTMVKILETEDFKKEKKNYLKGKKEFEKAQAENL